jgi:hypothetical protein
MLKGVKLEPTHTRLRSFSCKGLDAESAASYVFSVDGDEITVAAYFRKKYNIELRYPNLCLAIAGTASRKLRFPLEVRKRQGGLRLYSHE